MTACPKCKAPLGAEARFCGACGASIGPATPADPAYAAILGREIGGRYRVLSLIGEGGMGAVFRAEQLSLKRIVALKILRPELSQEASLVRRFNAEAELAARLTHPNTVTLYDFGQDADGSLYIAMEWIEGRSLRDLLQEGPVPALRTVAIAEQISASLGDAHGRGIVHRDLKPDNVMLTRRGKLEDIVRVVDFGIAKLRDEGGVTQMPMTQAGAMLGTPQYMAPEQIRGDKVDPRADIYALGALLYEMATGRPPFEDAMLTAVLAKHLTEVPMAPSLRRPDLVVPRALELLIMASLQKDPAARPPSMEAIAEQFAALRRELGSPRREPLGLYGAHTPPHGNVALPKTVKYDHPPVAVPAHLRQDAATVPAAASMPMPMPVSAAPAPAPAPAFAPQPAPAPAPFLAHPPVGTPPTPGHYAHTPMSLPLAYGPGPGQPGPHPQPGFGHAPYAPSPSQPGYPAAGPGSSGFRRATRPIWPWLLVAIVLGGGLGALIWWSRRQPSPPPPPASAPAPSSTFPTSPTAPPARPDGSSKASADFSITPTRRFYGE